MRIIGEWWLCDDGITRPTLRAKVAGSDGVLHSERFLVDTGADQTVFSAALLSKLHWQGNHTVPDYALQGVGGTSSFLVGNGVVELTKDDGTPARISGSFHAFTDPAATDMSILGRDVLGHFDVIASRRRNELLLLAGNHQYQVTTT